MHLRPVVLAGLFALTVVVGAVAEAPTTSELLDALDAKPVPHLPITIDYELVHNTSNFKGSDEQMKAAADRTESQLKKSLGHVDPEQRKELINFFGLSYRKSLREGSSTTYQGRAVLAPDFQAISELNSASPENKNDWFIEKGDTLIEYNEFNRSACVSKINRQRETALSRFQDMVGILGKLPPAIAAKAREGKTVAATNGYGVKFRDGTVAFAKAPDGTQPLLVSYNTEWPGNSTSLRFEDYKPFNAVWLPMLVTRMFKAAEVDIETIYRLSAVREGTDPGIPFINANVGYIQVLDRQTDPPINYDSDGQLATDEQLSAWRADASELQKHNNEVHSARDNLLRAKSS